MKKIKVDKSWSLFLDRDGVINKKLENDYVKKIREFNFIDGVRESICRFNLIFQKIVVVTNQQGIGKGLMTHSDLRNVHDFMLDEIKTKGGNIDKIYYCPELAAKNAACRKPNIGMAQEAKKDFSTIDFAKSIMVGDSMSDMEMGKRAGMKTVFISEKKVVSDLIDFDIPALPFLNTILSI